MATITIKTVDFEAYQSVAAVNAILIADISRADDWASVAATSRALAAVSASRWLDRLNWQGAAVSAPPINVWPRTDVTDKYGVAVSSASIPLDVLEAHALLTADLATKPSLLNSRNTGSNQKRVKADTVEVEFFTQVEGSVVPDAAMALIGQYLQGSVTTGSVATGTGETSGLTEKDYTTDGFH